MWKKNKGCRALRSFLMSGKKRFLSAALLLAAAAFLLFYAFGREETVREPLSIIFISKTIDDSDFWTQLIDGARMAAEEYGVKFSVCAPETEDDYKRQNELIEQAIREKPDAIVLTPSSFTETTPMAQKIVDSGIRLFLLDSEIDTEVAECMISTDNIKAGRLQGAFVKEILKPDSRIAVVAHVKNSSTAMEREQGLREGLGSDTEKIVDVVFCDSNYDKAYELMLGILASHPDVDVVVGLNEYSAVGAARAIVDKGLAGKISFVGFDSSLEEIKMLEGGIFRGMVIQNPFKMGYLGVETAVKALHGETVPEQIDSGSVLITRENMYLDENQEMLFPFKGE